MTDARRGDAAASVGAAFLRERLGPPRSGIVLGSGFAPLATMLGSAAPLAFEDVPGYPARRAPGHGGGVAAVESGGGVAWIFLGRLHTYEGLDAWTVAHPVRLLAAAGAHRVLLTCAAGGLRPADRPGDFAVVSDHINLLGDDPIRRLPPAGRSPAFPDLQGAYDPAWAAVWRDAARSAAAPLRDGVLASLAGPCYETPAEVRMLRALGADLVSMSVVPETIVARYLGLRVAAIACISNRGAGMDEGEAIAHEDVVDVVGAAVAKHAALFRIGLAAMIP
jgi:inosine/guanosine/xanthosine phosphorylase family protein